MTDKAVRMTIEVDGKVREFVPITGGEHACVPNIGIYVDPDDDAIDGALIDTPTRFMPVEWVREQQELREMEKREKLFNPGDSGYYVVTMEDGSMLTLYYWKPAVAPWRYPDTHNTVRYETLSKIVAIRPVGPPTRL